MFANDELRFRLIIAAQLLAMGAVRAYYSGFRREETSQTSSVRRAESAWLSALLAMLAILHFGTVFVYLGNPRLVDWCAFAIADPIRWAAIWISCLAMAGELWAAIALGTSYSPLLRVAEERRVVSAGPYRWIRHPLYAFWLPLMAGWGVAAGNWFILATGTVLILVLMIVRVPREEAMMLEGFGESYRQYMARTGRFIPRAWSRRGK